MVQSRSSDHAIRKRSAPSTGMIEQSRCEYGIRPVEAPKTGYCDAIILAEAHEQFRGLDASAFRAFGKGEHVLFDVKYRLPAGQVYGRL